MTHQMPSDSELMARLSGGDVSAIGELAHRHQHRVLELAFRTLGHWDLAEDVAQEAFLRVYRAAKTYQPQAEFTTWLYRIVVNLCLDEQRRRAKSATPLEAVAPEALPVSQANPAEKRNWRSWSRRRSRNCRSDNAWRLYCIAMMASVIRKSAKSPAGASPL